MHRLEDTKRGHTFQDTSGVRYLTPELLNKLKPDKRAEIEDLSKTGAYAIVPPEKIKLLRDVEDGNVDYLLGEIEELGTSLALIKANPQLNEIFVLQLRANLSKYAGMEIPDVAAEIARTIAQIATIPEKARLAVVQERERQQLAALMNTEGTQYSNEQVANALDRINNDTQTKLALVQAARRSADADYELSRAVGAKAVNATVIRIAGAVEGLFTGLITGGMRVSLRSSQEIAKAGIEYKGPALGILCAYIVYGFIYFQDNPEIIETLRNIPDPAEYFGTFFIGALAGALTEQGIETLLVWIKAIFTNGNDVNNSNNSRD